MLITRIELENIKSYRNITVDFRRGTTAISGANGAGKTTLVEAIGFTLFGYLPYNQDQFVREGEKGGKIVIHLIGSDDRPYTVERRVGSGARWHIYDEEADMRLEQRADVQDKLHDLFGIDRERPLDSLFRDALGVPQGTFTSIFLETGSKRKQTFDALLQIEDYKTAADNLLDTQHYYRDQMQGQQSNIDRLTFATRELDEWRTQLKDARLLDAQQKHQNVELSSLLTRHEACKITLDQQAARVAELEHQQRDARNKHEHARSLLYERQQRLQTARTAQQIITENQNDYQRHQQANAVLRQLRQEATKREALRKQQTTHSNTRIQITGRINNWQERLAEVTTARQRIIELAPLVDQQNDLERQRDEARQKTMRYEEIVATGKRVNTQITRLSQELEACQQRIAEIEPLVTIARQLDERSETYTQLRLQVSQRAEKQRQLQEKSTTLRTKQTEQAELAERLRKAENNVKVIEANRKEAEQMPILQAELEQLKARHNRLEGNIEGYARSRAQSAGGQCPLLNETCLNIGKRGITSLESYFENLLTTEKDQLAKVMLDQERVIKQIQQIQKYADALGKIDQYIEKRDLLAESMQHYNTELELLEHNITTLTQDLEQLQHIEARLRQAESEYQESKQADTKVRELDGLTRQREQLQQQSVQLESEIQELRQEATTLQSSNAQLKQLEAELSALNDPRSQSRAQQSILAKESTYQQQLQSEQEQLQEIEQHLHILEEQLAVYANLDQDISQQEVISLQSEKGYTRYQQYINEAKTLPEREESHQQQSQIAAQAEQHLQSVQQAYDEARAAFNQQELQNLQMEIEQLKNDLATLAQKMQYHQEYIKSLEEKIAEAETLRMELEEAQKEYQTLDELHKMTEQFRKMIKDAAPHVLRAMLADISAEANRIFGEVMGDRSAQISWRNDYEIILRRQGVDRSFAQLSGGEQMSAALAVRLALLKKLTTLNIAFFDEPTQNMDELRRMNLAEQIRRVRGFDQLIVISHDDTFEQGLDSLIRLNKVHGETQLIDEDGALPQAAIGQAWQSDEQRQPLLQSN